MGITTTLAQLERKQLFLMILEQQMGNITNTCAGVNIGRQTYYDWVKDDPNFALAVKFLREGLIDLAESRLLENVHKSDQRAIEFFLERQAKHRGYVKRTEHSGPDGDAIPLDHRLQGGVPFPPKPQTMTEWADMAREAGVVGEEGPRLNPGDQLMAPIDIPVPEKQPEPVSLDPDNATEDLD